MKKKILVIDAHPYEESFCKTLAENYFQGATEGGFEVKKISLRDLKFDPILHGGYAVAMELEEDLKAQQELITWCNHLVIVTPLWWAGMPTLLKGFIDRVFLPGFAFKYSDKSPMPEKMLDGRSATVIYTQGSPLLYSSLVLKDCFWNTLKNGCLAFCGFTPVKRLVLDQIASSTKEKRENFLKKVYKKGRSGF